MRGDEFFVQVSKRPPFTKLHPKVGGFFKDYLSQEKVVRFGDRFVVNTHFPPYPSRAFAWSKGSSRWATPASGGSIRSRWP